MNPTDQPEHALDLEQVLAILRRRWPVIALCLVLLTAGAFFFSERQTKKYTATASLVFNNNQVSQQVAGFQAVNTGEAKQQQTTNVKLLELGPTAAQTAHTVGDGLTEEKVKESLEVSAQGESNVVDVAVTWTSPTMAALIANTYANEFVNEQLASNHRYFASAEALVEKQLRSLSPQQRVAAQGLALQNRAQSLAILAELKAGDVQVAQAASVPASPSSPKVTRNTVLGLVVGLLLGVGLAFLIERLDRRIREPGDLERIYGLPLLGVVPESGALSKHTDTAEGAHQPLPDSEAEVFRLLRAHLRYFNVDRELHTLLVASAAPGDGKTTVARNLAEAAAQMGSRALLIETDLRRPTLSQRLGLPASQGLAGVLIGALPLGEAVHRIELESPHGGASGSARSLDVLSAGSVAPPNPAELIESQAMHNLLARVRADYDMVVIDTPPLTVVSDAFPLLSQADGVIVVGRVGRNRRDVATRLREILTGVDAPLLGVVANGFKPGKLSSYAYSYDYAYYRSERPAPNGNQPQRAGQVSETGADDPSSAQATPAARE